MLSVAETLNEGNELRLSVKEKIRLFECGNKPVIHQENPEPVRPKAVYIPKSTVEETKPEDNPELAVIYHDTFRSIMDVLFIFASVYAAIRLIIVLSHFCRCNC